MALLNGKVAVLMVGTRSFRLSMAQEFTRQGAAVVVSSCSAQMTAQVVAKLQAAGMKASGLACDVRESLQVQTLARLAFAAFRSLDVGVNNAGLTALDGPTVHVSLEHFTQMTNILGAFYGLLAAMRHFLGQGLGKLIHILGRVERSPQPMQNAYAASIREIDAAFLLPYHSVQEGKP
jgi:NAD(P)-dependent dehydrogenase (short-subunit alcohol dehydrogenase family)